MSAKNEFIDYVERLMDETNVPMSKEANLYWDKKSKFFEIFHKWRR